MTINYLKQVIGVSLNHRQSYDLIKHIYTSTEIFQKYPKDTEFNNFYLDSNEEIDEDDLEDMFSDLIWYIEENAIMHQYTSYLIKEYLIKNNDPDNQENIKLIKNNMKNIKRVDIYEPGHSYSSNLVIFGIEVQEIIVMQYSRDDEKHRIKNEPNINTIFDLTTIFNVCFKDYFKNKTIQLFTVPTDCCCCS